VIRPETMPVGISEDRTGQADRWVSRAVGATVAGLAGIAGAISYSHMRQLAQEHGQAGWQAHAFPLSVEGVEIVASLVLLADRRAGRRSGRLPWAALAIGTAGNLAANVATAGPGSVSRLIAGWPALALLIAVKLLSGMLDCDASRRPVAVLSRPPSSDADMSTSQTAVPSGTSAMRPAGPGQSADRAAAGMPLPSEPGTVPGMPPAIAVFLPAARAAAAELQRDGRALTRDGLAARLRQDGYPIRNARLTALLEFLRRESTAMSLAADVGAVGAAGGRHSGQDHH